MPAPQSLVGGLIERVFGRLRFPYLFLLTLTLFVLDLMIPDFVPLADELILGLGTLLFAAWRRRKGEDGDGPGEAP